MMTMDLFVRGSSYYFITYGRPALGSLWIGLVALAATLFSLRDWRQNWAWLSIIGMSIVVSLSSGGPPGIRRAVPAVVALGILSTLFLVELSKRFKPAVAGVVAAAILAHLSISAYGYWVDLADRHILVQDFPFENLPGLNMVQSLAAMRDGLAPVPTDFQKYDPDRTLGILYMTARRRPVVSAEHLLGSAAVLDILIDPHETRFQRLLE